MNRYMKHAKLKKNQNSSQSGSQMLHNNPNNQNPVRMPLVHKSIKYMNRNNYHAQSDTNGDQVNRRNQQPNPYDNDGNQYQIPVDLLNFTTTPGNRMGNMPSL